MEGKTGKIKISRKKEVKGFIERVLDGSLSPVLAHFIQETDLTVEDVAKLRRLLEQKEQKSVKDSKRRRSS